MKDYNKEIEDFRQFATDKLNVHKKELQTRYENEKIDEETLAKGYAEHRKILEIELQEKVKLLAGSENPWLKEELNNISSNMVKQLSTNHS